jgi:hypothetical protein
MDDRELLWRQYELSIDMFKHYLKLTVEFNVFFYGITGAVLSYYFAHSADAHMHYALLLPFVMSIAFACFLLYGASLMGALRKEVIAVQDALELIAGPDVVVLSVFLVICAILMFVVAAGLGYILWGWSAA